MEFRESRLRPIVDDKPDKEPPTTPEEPAEDEVTDDVWADYDDTTPTQGKMSSGQSGRMHGGAHAAAFIGKKRVGGHAKKITAKPITVRFKGDKKK